MKDTWILAIDLGTSFIKAGIYDTATSECLAVATEPVKDYRPGPGIFIQKGEELFESVIACIKNVVSGLDGAGDKVQAISFTGQMAGFMGVDEN